MNDVGVSNGCASDRTFVGVCRPFVWSSYVVVFISFIYTLAKFCNEFEFTETREN